MIKLLPYSEGDVYRVELKANFFKEAEAYAGSEKAALNPNNEAKTIFLGDKIIGVIGTNLMWNGVIEVWSVLSEDVRLHPLSFHRAVKQEIDALFKKVHRLQAVVLSDFCSGRRWLQMLGFTYEGTMRKFGPFGDNFDIWARVK